MTNYEKIKGMTPEELAEFLCSKMQICSLCEARDCCSVGHTGYIDWLKKEAEGSET